MSGCRLQIRSDAKAAAPRKQKASSRTVLEGSKSRICVGSFLCSKAANVIDEVPDLLGTDSRSAVQAFHRGTEAIADVDENFSVCGSVVPFFVGQIRSFWFSSRGQLLGRLAIAMACCAVALGAQAIIKPLAGGEGLGSRCNGILDCLWIGPH